MTPDAWYRRFLDLQQYLGWTEDDARRMVALGPVVESELGRLVEDFYASIERNPATRAARMAGRSLFDRQVVFGAPGADKLGKIFLDPLFHSWSYSRTIQAS